MPTYHIHVNEQSTGPFTEEQVREKLAAGEINDETLVWAEGSPDWVALKELKLEKPKIQLRRPEPDLQFEHAEFEKPAGGATVTCSGCKTAIADVYYDVNGKIACQRCRDGVQTQLDSGSGMMRFVRALGAGIGAAAVGAGVWYAILKLANMELGIIAIGVGFLVGFAVRWGSQGRGGWLYQLLAMFLTYCAIVSTYMPFIVQAFREGQDKAKVEATSTNQLVITQADMKTVNEQPAKPERTLAVMMIAYVFIFALAFASPFLGGISNIIGLIIIGIALYEAWKINKRVPIAITGPFRVGAPR